MKKTINQNYQIINKKTNKHKQIYQETLSVKQKNLIKIKKRILNIIDSQFQILQNKMHQYIKNYRNSDNINNIGNYIINQAKLQDWILTLQNQIIQWKVKNQPIIYKSIKQKKYKPQQNETQCQQFVLKKPIQKSNTQKILFQIQNNKLITYKFNQNNMLNCSKPNKQMIQQEKLTFKQNIINKNCSLTYVQQLKTLFLIGGSLSQNPNLKSSNILCYSIINKQIEQLLTLNSTLPYGISSHGSVYDQINKQIYLIGGNRNHSVVSRGCFKVKLEGNFDNIQHQNYNKQFIIQQIACLNYPAASMSCLIWKNKWIYKIGGIGEAFDQWGNSPYIERYSIQINQWEVINPSISSSINIDFISKYGYMANSLCYLTNNQNQLIILGGYSFEGKGSNYGMSISLYQQDNNYQSDDIISISNTSVSPTIYHQITEFGKIKDLQKGGFISNQCFSINYNKISGYIFALASKLENQFIQYPVFLEFQKSNGQN